jgi:hypothetical protein
VKIYVAAVEALRIIKRQVETQEKFDGFLSFTPPPLMLMYFFAFKKNLTLCMTKLRVLLLSFPDFTDISIMCRVNTQGVAIVYGIAKRPCLWQALAHDFRPMRMEYII